MRLSWSDCRVSVGLDASVVFPGEGDVRVRGEGWIVELDLIVVDLGDR